MSTLTELRAAYRAIRPGLVVGASDKYIAALEAALQQEKETKHAAYEELQEDEVRILTLEAENERLRVERKAWFGLHQHEAKIAAERDEAVALLAEIADSESILLRPQDLWDRIQQYKAEGQEQ